MDRIDKRLDGITKLMRMGAKAMIATDKRVNALAVAHKRTDEKINALIEAQQRTDKKFDRFMEAFLKKDANGRHN